MDYEPPNNKNHKIRTDEQASLYIDLQNIDVM